MVKLWREAERRLVYSKSTVTCFCGPCKLHGETSVVAKSGDDWKNSNLITNHENSPDYRKCLYVEENF